MATKKKIDEEEREPIAVSETQLAAEARTTLEILRGQERVRFTVMPDGSGDRKIRVKLNGTVWEYAVGQEQEAPRDVYALIATKWKTIQQANTFKRNNADRDMGTL